MKYKLMCFDMDGVLFTQKNFWMELHKALDTEEIGKEVTRKYLLTDYQKLVEEVHKLWEGKDAEKYITLVKEAQYMKGVPTLFEWLHKLGIQTAIISSGSIDLARRVQKDFGVDHVFGNELLIEDGKINASESKWPIENGHGKKVEIIEDLAADLQIDLKEVIFVGDDESDIDAMEKVGLGIAFNGSENVNAAAKISIEEQDLGLIIPMLERLLNKEEQSSAVPR